MTPEEFRDALLAELELRQPYLKLRTDYYNGDHRLQFASSKFKEAFGNLFSEFATNWCGLVVDVAVERLTVLGFRFSDEEAPPGPAKASRPPGAPGPPKEDVKPSQTTRPQQAKTNGNGKPASLAGTPEPGDPRLDPFTPPPPPKPVGDQRAWKIWQANDLDKRSIMAHTDSVKLGTSYIWVGPPKKPGGEPQITVEHPSQAITYHDPSDRRVRLAGLKLYMDPDGNDVCVLYTQDEYVVWMRERIVNRVQGLGLILPRIGTGADWVVKERHANFLGVVPIIPLENNPDTITGGRSDLDPAIRLNDAANKFFMDMIHGSEYTSFPQRVATGVELPRDPVTGEVLTDVEIRAAVSRLWAFEAPDAKVLQLAQGSLEAYVEGVDLAVQHMAAQTRTPPHYLLAKLANISADALVAAEAGLVHRCKRKLIDFADPWEEGMRIAFMHRANSGASLGTADAKSVQDDTDAAGFEDAEVIWAQVQNYDPITLSQSLTMKAAVGVPEEILWEEAGYTPQQIDRMHALKAAQQQVELEREKDLVTHQAEQAALNPTTPPPGAPPSGQRPPPGQRSTPTQRRAAGRS
jgi:hypothetical protein